MRAFAGGRGYAKLGLRQPNLKPNVYCFVIHAMSYAEQEPDEVLNALSAGSKGGIYMGAAGLLNLSFMAASKSSGAILFDVNPTQTWFWQTIVPMIAEADNGTDFMNTLVQHTEYLQLNVARIYRLSGNEGIAGTILKPDMPPSHYTMFTYLSSPMDEWHHYKDHGFLRWVEDEEGFRHIRSMAQRGAIAALTLDVLDKAGWSQLAHHLATGPVGVQDKVKTIYMSNILTFLMDGTSDYTFRNDLNSSPVHAREVVSQVLNDTSHIITETAEPSMEWPELTKEEFWEGFGNYGPTVS